jgi:hypothetical protein
MDKVLVCTSCGAQLTVALRLLSGKDPSVPAVECRDGLPPADPGTVYKSYEPIVKSFDGLPAPLEFTPQYWVNPADLTDSVELTKDERRLIGCCGPSGLDGPNQVCRCGAEIGTLQSDCFTAHVFIPEPGATDWVAVPGDEGR